LLLSQLKGDGDAKDILGNVFDLDVSSVAERVRVGSPRRTVRPGIPG
jgi:hypothetical protein